MNQDASIACPDQRSPIKVVDYFAIQCDRLHNAAMLRLEVKLNDSFDAFVYPVICFIELMASRISCAVISVIIG